MAAEWHQKYGECILWWTWILVCFIRPFSHNYCTIFRLFGYYFGPIGLALYWCFVFHSIIIVVPMFLATNTTTKNKEFSTTVYCPQILLCLLLFSFSLAFLIYCTDCCRLFWNFVTISLQTFCLLERHFLAIFRSPIIISTHTFFLFSLQETGCPLLAL